MRKIKFRAWDAHKKEWVNDGYLEEWIKHPDRLKVMQFTGLKDKNGKEIWEGDIVTNGFSKGVVNVDATDWSWGNYKLQNRFQKSLEVIGNIYEHGHLLNDTKESA